MTRCESVARLWPMRSLLFLAVLLASRASSPTPTKSNQNDEAHAAHEKRVGKDNQGDAKSISSAIDKLTSEVTSWEQRQSRSQNIYDRPSEWWVKAGTIMSAIATVAIAILGGLQWWAMRSQRAVMKEQAGLM